MELQQEEKRRIAQFAAGLIQPDDFVYLDAGTTTGYILDYLPARSATFVTNAVSHAKRLAAAGNRVILIGGELKGTTEAVIGSQAILTIQGYHFTKGFFGTNGVSKRHGFTTPDPNEALVKQEAMRQTERCYVLADSQKFGMVSSVTFGIKSTVFLPISASISMEIRLNLASVYRIAAAPSPSMEPKFPCPSTSG